MTRNSKKTDTIKLDRNERNALTTVRRVLTNLADPKWAGDATANEALLLLLAISDKYDPIPNLVKE